MVCVSRSRHQSNQEGDVTVFIPYINYRELDKEFYTIPEVCRLFQVEKSYLKEKSKLHHIDPRQNEIGEYGFVKYDVRKLHNLLYHEDREDKRTDDPWA